MKILRIIPSMNPKQGGPCQGIRNSIPQLQKLGFNNEVVCFDKSDSKYLEQDSFKIHALGEGKTPFQYNKNLVTWLLSHLNQFDVVVVHGLWLYHSHAAIKAILSFRKQNKSSPKIYIMPHGMLDPYFQKANDRKLKALRNIVYWKLFENKVINKADGILFTCEEELLLARTTFPNYNPKKEINVGYGIQPPPAFHENMKKAFSSNVPQWNGKPFLLFLSRIHSKKGVDMLITAYKQLEIEYENIPQLIIAGPNNHMYGKEMKELAQGSINILFAGMLSGNAKWGAFYESEVFVLPSHQENFGIAVVEALATKTPVLISNKVNIWREIEKGKGGIIKNDSSLETYNLIKDWLLLNKNQKNTMTMAAEKVYHDNFTIKFGVKKFITGISQK